MRWKVVEGDREGRGGQRKQREWCETRAHLEVRESGICSWIVATLG